MVKTLLLLIWLYFCLFCDILNTALQFDKNNYTLGITFLMLTIALLIVIIKFHISNYKEHKEKIKSQNFVVDHKVKYWLCEFTAFLK